MLEVWDRILILRPAHGPNLKQHRAPRLHATSSKESGGNLFFFPKWLSSWIIKGSFPVLSDPHYGLLPCPKPSTHLHRNKATWTSEGTANIHFGIPVPAWENIAVLPPPPKDRMDLNKFMFLIINEGAFVAKEQTHFLTNAHAFASI